MVRGSNNKFYYVECDKSQAFDLIYELHVFLRPNSDDNCWSKKWDWTKKQIFELNSGRAIALELDPNYYSIKNSGVVPARAY